MSIKKIVVVTVSYGSERVLPDFLESLSGASARQLDAIIADNKPEAGSPVAALAKENSALYLAMEENGGYGRAVNAAVAAADPDAEWILISNPDVVLGADSIDHLLERAHSDERIAAVGPRILGSDGEIYPSARAVPSLGNGIGHALFSTVWKSNPWTRAYRAETNASNDARAAGWLSGACLLVRRSAFDEIGGFDPDFFMYFEDVDLGYRLGLSGWVNFYEPSAVVVHTGAHSTSSDMARMTLAHHESARRFLDKRYPGARWAPLRLLLRVGLGLRSSIEQRRSR